MFLPLFVQAVLWFYLIHYTLCKWPKIPHWDTEFLVSSLTFKWGAKVFPFPINFQPQKGLRGTRKVTACVQACFPGRGGRHCIVMTSWRQLALLSAALTQSCPCWLTAVYPHPPFNMLLDSVLKPRPGGQLSSWLARSGQLRPAQGDQWELWSAEGWSQSLEVGVLGEMRTWCDGSLVHPALSSWR